MGHYRLHIDIPFDPSLTEEECIRRSEMVMAYISNTTMIEKIPVEQVNYRLGHDDDRQKSNYMDKDKNGHVSNKKHRIVFSDGQRESKRIVSDTH